MLDEIEEELLGLDSGVEGCEEKVASIRRVVHTLKAEFAVLDMLPLQQLCHQAETTIDAVVEGGLAFPVDPLLALVDLLKRHFERLTENVHAECEGCESMLASLRAACEAPAAAAEEVPPAGVPAELPAEGAAEPEDAPIVLEVEGEFADSLPEFIGEARSHLGEAEGAMVELSRDPDSLDNLHLTFRAYHTIKGVASFLNLEPIVSLAHAAEALLHGGRSERYAFESQDIDLVLAAGDLISQMIGALEGEPAPSAAACRELEGKISARASRGLDDAAEPAASTATEAASPAAEAAVPDDAGAPAGESVGEPASDSGGAVVQPQPPVKPKAELKAARVERTIKVSTTRLDMLVDMVGELVIAQSMVLQDPAIQQLDSQVLARNIGQVGKITRDLQEAAMSLRMVTVKSTFQKMARLVRDVSRKCGKRVNLSIIGEDTELDRNVVEQISDPLVHMIRNAIDHGIEMPADRVAAGKEEEGQLALRAFHQGGSIVIEIKDDGRGIDRARVFRNALDKGLLEPGTNPKSMTDSEVFNLIFMPGFSTADAVTDLSGRGVGMDVVRRNIEALRGKIEIESSLGRGTTFRLRLPLTLAIIDGMVVRIGKSRYVVPTLSIEQSFRPNIEDVHHVIDRGECVHVRGSVLPIYRLNEIFGQDDGCERIEEGILIVVEVDGQRSCLFVDEILGQQQVVIKSLGMSRDRIVGLSGGAIMTDGRVALILDVGTLVDSILTT